MSLIPDHLWTQMSEDEQRLYKETIQGLRRQGREADCPHCGKPIRILTTHTIRAKDDDDPSADARPAKPVSPVEARLLESARTSGLLEAFAVAARAETEHGGVPNDMDGFFLEFWKLAKPTLVAAPLLAAWIDEFGGRIRALQAVGIVAVLSDGQLVAFVPNRLTQPTAVPGTGPRPKMSNAASLEVWRKGRFGYVPVGARSFGDALAKRSVGAFGSLVQ